MIREFEARFTAGRRSRTVTFTVATQGGTLLPRKEIVPVAFGELSQHTTVPMADWTLERLIETTDGMAGDVE